MNLSIGMISSVLIQELPFEVAARVMLHMMKAAGSDGIPSSRGEISGVVAELGLIADLSYPTDVSGLGERVTESARDVWVPVLSEASDATI